MTTGQLIKIARKNAGMTQSELAEKLGIPYQSVSQWERNTRKPKRETIQRIAAALGVEWMGLVPKEEQGQEAVDHMRDELKKLGLEMNLDPDDEEIFKILLPHVADLEPLTDEEIALKTLLNSLGYDINKVKGEYGFTTSSSAITISEDDLNELLACAKSGLKVAAKTLELRKLREIWGPNYPNEIVLPYPPKPKKD